MSLPLLLNAGYTSDGVPCNRTARNESLWEQDHDVLIASYPTGAFTFMGVFVSVVGFLGLVANGTVLIIFSRFKRLRSPPANIFIINLAISDLCASAFHSMAAYSNFQGRWAFGRLGCELYAMAVGLFGLASILTFSAIACERCLVIACPLQGTMGLSEGRLRVTRSHAKKVCFAIWLHCLALTVMPLLGWSQYVPEGLLTSCSWDYTTRTASNRAYYVVLLVSGFALPVGLICASYGRIMASVVSHARQMVCLNKQSSAFRKLRRQTEIRTAQVVVMLIFVYLVAWTPYAVVTLIGQFGPIDRPLSPVATAVPAYFAKTAVVLDPLVYGFSHPHFRSSLKHYLSSLLANQSLSHVSVNAHKSATVGAPPINSTYQSRGLTIYPSGPPTSEHHYYVSGRTNSNKRRMLRTFRDLSQETNDAAGNRNHRPSDAVIGVLELTQSCAAVVTVPLERPQRTSVASTSSSHSRTSPLQPGNGSPPAGYPAAVHQWRYKARGLEIPTSTAVAMVSDNCAFT